MLHIGERFERFHVGRLVVLTAFTIFVSGYFDLARAQQPGQTTFASAEHARAVLFRAVENDNQTALLQILGPTAKEIVTIGAEAEDLNSRQQFIENYQRKGPEMGPNGAITLFVGAEKWPLRIFLVEKANRWYFEPAASKTEILFRRIGRNELETIQFCRDSLVFILAVRQFGPLLPPANTQDYAKETIERRPLSGYYFRVLTRQGKHAPGGTKNYIVNGKMTGGFALVAYPADYRSSGVMTFIVNLDGIVYQKDLGPRTAIRAKTLTQYDPDATWKKVE